jgi:hypothetical protein
MSKQEMRSPDSYIADELDILGRQLSYFSVALRLEVWGYTNVDAFFDFPQGSPPAPTNYSL